MPIKLENYAGVCVCSTITRTNLLPTQHGTHCVVFAGVFWITPLTAPISPRVTITCLGHWRRLWKQAVQFRWGGSWGSGTMVHPATRVHPCGGCDETCAAFGQVGKQWWSVRVACLVLPSVFCNYGVLVVVKYILYTFLDPCLCFTWTTLIYRVSQEECARLREDVPYVKVCRYNPKHLCPKLNVYVDNGQRSLKLWQVLHTCWLPNTYSNWQEYVVSVMLIMYVISN
jgi:hypothetical protein